MKKQLCITTFVFGDKYQEYIPYFLFFILKVYGNDYTPIVFVHSNLKTSVTNQLLELDSLEGDFIVIEKYLQKYSIDGQRAAAMRYVIDVPLFCNYESIYWGDVDMFILPENPPLFEQHWNHCDVIGLPYSNIVRECNSAKTMSEFKSRMINEGIISALLYLIYPRGMQKRLSGLHFAKTEEYFMKVRPLFQKYFDIIVSSGISGITKTIHHKSGFNDECLLYDMIEESGIGIPKQCDYGTFMLDYRNYHKPAFRPHHGIHFGIFRDNKTMSFFKNILDMDIYFEYYQKLKDLIDDDPVFDLIYNQSPEYIQEMFSRMHEYYALN